MMPKKLSLKDLKVESFTTSEPSQIKGGITGNNTWCKSNLHNPCGESIDFCSELYSACCPKTNHQKICWIEKEEEKFKLQNKIYLQFFYDNSYFKFKTSEAAFSLVCYWINNF